MNQYDENESLKNYSSIRNSSAIYEFPKVSFEWDQDCFDETRQIQRDLCIIDDESAIKGYFYYFGTNPIAIPSVDGKYIAASALSRDTYWKTHGTTWNDPYGVKLPIIFNAEKGKNYFILQAQDLNGNISSPLLNIEYIYESDNFKDIKNFTIKKPNDETIGLLNYPAQEGWDYESRVIETNQPTLILCPDYGYNIDGLVYYISYQDDKWWFDKTRNGIVTKNQCITVNNLDDKEVTNLFIKPNSYSINNFFGKHHVLTIHYLSNAPNIIQPANKILMTNWNNNTVFWTESKNNIIFQKIDSTLINTLKGKILLQVEAHGEAFYVYPKDGKRYYMANGNEAYRIMRYLGIGITNIDLNRIKTNKTFAKLHSGKIFLQVEAHGEAFYIDFDGNAHYLKDGSAAYIIMRDLGLGITNNDLSKIPEGVL